MKKCIALSAAVLASTFTLAPLAGAQQAEQNTQRQEQREQQQRQEQRAQEAGSAGERRAEGEAGERHQMNADQHFLREAAADNQFEIQLSQFVEQQAQNPQVKELAHRLVEDHQRAQEQLQQLAQGMNMQLPSQIEPWQQAKLQAMQQKHGEHLEMHYTFGQVGGHTMDLLSYQYEASHGQNEQVKQYAQQTIPVLQRHLQLAQQTAEQWVPEARTAGEHMRGDRDRNERGIRGKDQPGNSNRGENNRGENNQGVNR